MDYAIRLATFADKPELEALIARSARELSAAVYSPAQIEGALRGAFGVDTQLIADGTYFVVSHADALIGCGGWSCRRTLFGSDAGAHRDAAALDPRSDAARIRAFFVDAAYARRGVGSALLQYCENAARARGFSSFELMATLPRRAVVCSARLRRGYACSNSACRGFALGRCATDDKICPHA